MAHHDKEVYETMLRKRIVEDYVKEHKRSPTRAALFELEREYRKRYPNLDVVGFSGIDLKRPNFNDSSSSAVENKNRRAMKEDLLAAEERISELIELMDDSFKGYMVTANRCHRLVKSVERRLNNLILLNGKSDVFLYGVEESFDTNEHIDFENTTASVEPGYVTLGRDGAAISAIDATRLSFYVNADRGHISARPSTNINCLKEEDGNIWDYYVYTNYKSGRVSLVIEADFDSEEGMYVGEVRLTGSGVDVNGMSSWNVLYSLDGSTYNSLDSERVFRKGMNSVSVGLESVKKIQIIVTKDAADDISPSGGQNAYIFSLDSLEITSDQFNRHSESVLYCGPYEITDEFNQPVNFSLATLGKGTCCIYPGTTSVSFFLSKDNVNWFPASYNGDSYSVVQFNSTNPAQSINLIDESKSRSSIILEPTGTVDVEYAKEGLLNLFISNEWSDKFVLRNTYVERNLSQGDAVELYGVPSGWFYDENTQQYKTVIEVQSIEGRLIDLGTSSAYIDGRLVSGQVNLPKGYHKFSTPESNWYQVPTGIQNADDLREQDPLYPFNHKLIVEGYPYEPDFSGEKVYNGVERNFGSLLEYVTPEKFNNSEFDNDLNIYTIEDYYGNLYFKIKVDPSDSSWQYEQVYVKYMLRLDEVNTLYVKAILKSNDSTLSPHILSFQARVV